MPRELRELPMTDDDYEILENGHGGIASFATGILVGAMVGLAVGVLFAPASGHVTRRRLRRRFDRLRDEAEDRVGEFGRRARRRLEQIRS